MKPDVKKIREMVATTTSRNDHILQQSGTAFGGLCEYIEKLEAVAEAAQLLCNDTGDDAMAVGAIVCGIEEWANLCNALSALDAEVKNDAQNS